MALEARGFGAKTTRTFLLEPHFRAADAVAAAICAVVLVAAASARLMGFGALPGASG